jgi:tetratricopeptide (TPR) repeat protein
MGDRLAMLELGADNPDVAITILEETRPQLAALGLDSYRATQTAHLADALYRLGRLDEAEQMARQAEAESAPDDTSNFIIIPAVLAHIHAERGDADAALKLAEQAVETAYRTDGPHDHARAELALAHARATAGQQPEAVQAARRALACYQLKGDHTSAARVENWIDSLANNSPRKTPA